MKRHLILSILHDYQYPVTEPFIRSLKGAGYKGDLVIFVSNTITKATKRTLKGLGVILIEYNTTYPFMPGNEQLLENIAPSITINNYRFIFYLKFLQENKDRYDNIMLTDIRDVIFQKNIFDLIQNDKIYYFLEDETQLFCTSKLNYDWYLNANGLEATNQIVDKNVSCAGIVIGAYEPVLKYLNYMKTKFKLRDDLNWGLDQGVHNEYVHTISDSSALIIENSYPLVLTLGACSGYQQDEAGALINKKGEVYAVVHQYDRFGALLVYFKKKFMGNYYIQLLKKVLFITLP